eukprot:1119895_1
MSICTSPDMTSVLDVVLQDLDNIMATHIPPVYNYNQHVPFSFHRNTVQPFVSFQPNHQAPRTPNRTTSYSNVNCASTSVDTRDPNRRTHVSPRTRTNPISSAINSHAFMSVFRPDHPHRVELKDHVFISKDATFQLSRYIAYEEWGRDCVLLYKYLDYIFRCQLFSNQVFKLLQPNPFTGRATEYLVFHIGLHRRSDNALLYCLLAPNTIFKTHRNAQKWRVMFGNIEESFMSKTEILAKFRASNISCLPQRTVFADSPMDSVFNPAYSIEVSWEERLIVNQGRIHRIIGDDAYFDKNRKHLKLSQLVESFGNALHATKRMLSSNPSLAVPQGFIDTKHCSFRMELLLPLHVRFNGKMYTFALAIGKSSDQSATYTAKSVLTVNMAYANARLIAPVDALWLKGNQKRNRSK